jgi:hypothetical protein
MKYADRHIPNTIDQAVILLVSYLSSKDKRKITKFNEDNLSRLSLSLGVFIKNEFKLINNDRLIESCRAGSGGFPVYADEASLIIIRALWKRLRELHQPMAN